MFCCVNIFVVSFLFLKTLFALCFVHSRLHPTLFHWLDFVIIVVPSESCWATKPSYFTTKPPLHTLTALPFTYPHAHTPHFQHNSYDSPNRRRQTLSLPHHSVACNNLRTASLPLNYAISMPSGHTTYPLHHHHMLRPTKSTSVKGLVFLLWPTSPLVTW